MGSSDINSGTHHSNAPNFTLRTPAFLGKIACSNRADSETALQLQEILSVES